MVASLRVLLSGVESSWPWNFMRAHAFWKVVLEDKVDFLDRLIALLTDHHIRYCLVGGHLRVQIQTDPRYAPFVGRAVHREILGVRLPVASLEDLLQGKLWAVTDATRRPSKRQKDLADIARLVEAYPALRTQVPGEVLAKLV